MRNSVASVCSAKGDMRSSVGKTEVGRGPLTSLLGAAERGADTEVAVWLVCPVV